MKRIFSTLLLAGVLVCGWTAASHGAPAAFVIGEKDFLLDGKPFLIRCGEMHFARIPRADWPHRLRMAHAMGLNTVCAYLFWNVHEPAQDRFDFSGNADVAEFCRAAHREGLKVILRPGPYSCAEWDFGGLPYWLLKTPDLKVRTQDPRYLAACRRYLRAVGRELASLQASRGGPILMVQVENEYGSYGNDKEYIGILRDDLKAAGFDVPLFTCDGPTQLKNDVRDDLFCVVNFGSNPEANFKALREIRPTGPLMCGEYYPGWFDGWGSPHHLGDSARIAQELGWMLEHNASFSIYMAHGGTSFGFSAGANSPPYAPQITSYDYDAPISEAGWDTPKFYALRELFLKHLAPGETLPDVPARHPVIRIDSLELAEIAPLFANLPAAKKSARPQSMESYDQAYGCILYRTRLPAGRAGQLRITQLHDYGLVFLDGQKIATLDRRRNQNSLSLPARTDGAVLEVLVEAMGRVNYGSDIHDRKGITEKVEWLAENGAQELSDWETFNLPLDSVQLKKLKFQKLVAPDVRRGTTVARPIPLLTSGATSDGHAGRMPALPGEPAFYRGSFRVERAGDTFLDVSTWGKGVVWVNGHNLGRFWNIGPQQTLYCPGSWLKAGRNELVVFELNGAQSNRIAGLTEPILNTVHVEPALSTHRSPGQALKLEGVRPVATGAFSAGQDWQTVKFDPVKGRYVCLEALNTQGGDVFATGAEIYLVGADGKDLSRDAWKIVYADSEEVSAEDGTANNVFDLQPTTFWHTQWSGAQPEPPHQLVIDLGGEHTVSGLRYLPRQDGPNGHIKDYQVYVSPALFPGL